MIALYLANSLLLLLAGTTVSFSFLSLGSTTLSPLSGLNSLLLGDRLSMLLM